MAYVHQLTHPGGIPSVLTGVFYRVVLAMPGMHLQVTNKKIKMKT